MCLASGTKIRTKWAPRNARGFRKRSCRRSYRLGLYEHLPQIVLVEKIRIAFVRPSFNKGNNCSLTVSRDCKEVTGSPTEAGTTSVFVYESPSFGKHILPCSCRSELLPRSNRPGMDLKRSNRLWRGTVSSVCVPKRAIRQDRDPRIELIVGNVVRLIGAIDVATTPVGGADH